MSKKRPQKQTPGPQEHKKMCGFCGAYQHQCVLLVKSPITNFTICGVCAMTITQQCMAHMTSTSSLVRQLMKEYPHMFEQDPATGAVTVVSPNGKLTDAIEKAGSNGSEQGN